MKLVAWLVFGQLAGELAMLVWLFDFQLALVEYGVLYTSQSL
jgi:hypothetical protein